MLIAAVWISATLFGLYILSFYFGAILGGDPSRWNEVLPDLYVANARAGNVAIGLHFATGGLILVLGCIQLMAGVRNRFPYFHRWIGRAYVGACLLAAAGGLAFILLRGTVGGLIMDIGFGLYGVLVGLCAVQTIRYARGRDFARHRAWAIRLFALAIGSWLYRMDYGFWVLLTNGLGHSSDFTGPFDRVMAFFFYVPNLVVAEWFIRARQARASIGLQHGVATVLALATIFIVTGTWFFTRYYWGPAIIAPWIG